LQPLWRLSPHNRPGRAGTPVLHRIRPHTIPSPHNPRSPQNLRRSTAQACRERSRRGCPASVSSISGRAWLQPCRIAPSSPDPTAHVGADALVRPVRQCRRERPARAVASKGLGSAESILENCHPERAPLLREGRTWASPRTQSRNVIAIRRETSILTCNCVAGAVWRGRLARQH